MRPYWEEEVEEETQKCMAAIMFNLLLTMIVIICREIRKIFIWNWLKMLIHIYNRINNHWLILATLSANIDHTKYMASMLGTNFFLPMSCVSLPMAIVHAAKWPLVKPEVASRNGTRQTTRNDVIYCRQLESFKQISMIIIIIIGKPSTTI